MRWSSRGGGECWKAKNHCGYGYQSYSSICQSIIRSFLSVKRDHGQIVDCLKDFIVHSSELHWTAFVNVMFKLLFMSVAVAHIFLLSTDY